MFPALKPVIPFNGSASLLFSPSYLGAMKGLLYTGPTIRSLIARASCLQPGIRNGGSLPRLTATVAPQTEELDLLPA